MMPRNTAYDLPTTLFEFAFCRNYDTDVVDEIKNLAEQEDWNYRYAPSTVAHPILNNYLKYTYKKIASERKIAISANEEKAAFNTGLLTSNLEPIFMMFKKNNNTSGSQYWHHYKFLARGSGELNSFSSLPEIASYFENPASLFFDARKELRVNYDHIINDNFERFPDSIKSLGQLVAKNTLIGAVNSAIERVKRNYKIAIPQFYDNRIQILLPLNLINNQQSNLALVVEDFNDFYRSATCLTLDMAYNNARQLTRPDRDWLNP